jgi:Ca2+-binding EF-hand superfamily protein
MAKIEIFQIFDTDRSGYVDYFEFLINLSSFRQGSLTRSPERLYFEIFDIDNSESISKDELISVLSKLFEDSVFYNDKSEEDDDYFDIDKINNINFDELFHDINDDAQGDISFAEFEIFLRTINYSTNKL